MSKHLSVDLSLVVVLTCLAATCRLWVGRPGAGEPPNEAALIDGQGNDPPADEVPPSDAGIDYGARRVFRLAAVGAVLWSTPLEGYLGSRRPRHLLQDNDRVYVSHGDGVTALDAGTGKPAWHSPGPADRMLLSGDLLLATGCSQGGADVAARGRWLTARAVATGAEAFRVQLPPPPFDPLPIREVAGLFLIQATGAPGGRGAALLVDRGGPVRHRLDREVVEGQRRGEDLVLLTSRDVVRVTPDGRTAWASRMHNPEGIAGGGLLALAGGDLLAFLYGEFSDSGVQVVRLDPGTGRAVWQSFCEPLGVPHSAYRHQATVALEGSTVKVISRGTRGTFVERLDLRSGERVGRTHVRRW
jgi:outer membrane protein assembly factor BamB